MLSNDMRYEMNDKCRIPPPANRRFYGVEFTMGNTAPSYLFKLRSTDTNPMFVLIKENSDILDQLKVGHIFILKFYSHDSTAPIEHLEARIDEITIDKKGRFKGHYLVGLSIVRRPAKHQMH